MKQKRAKAGKKSLQYSSPEKTRCINPGNGVSSPHASMQCLTMHPACQTIKCKESVAADQAYIRQMKSLCLTHILSPLSSLLHLLLYFMELPVILHVVVLHPLKKHCNNSHTTRRFLAIK